ncbi:MAG: hypothetical protein ACYC1I_12440 [Acidimicrobiales bacterium]
MDLVTFSSVEPPHHATPRPRAVAEVSPLAGTTKRVIDLAASRVSP